MNSFTDFQLGLSPKRSYATIVVVRSNKRLHRHPGGSMSDEYENSGNDRTESARKRRQFLAGLGERSALKRFTGAAAVTVAVGAAMVAGSGSASAAGCTPNGSPVPMAQSQTYYCGGYWDHYDFVAQHGNCYDFDWWWDILACAGGPSMKGPITVCG
jgi:hypothetical protein